MSYPQSGIPAPPDHHSALLVVNCITPYLVVKKLWPIIRKHQPPTCPLTLLIHREKDGTDLRLSTNDDKLPITAVGMLWELIYVGGELLIEADKG
jgi:hypothetical protein